MIKKNNLIIQITLLGLAILLIFFTYFSKKKEPSIAKNEDSLEINSKIQDTEKNFFENVEYKGIDLKGNRYIIKSKFAEFELDRPEIINMKIMKATFYFKDGTTLKVDSDQGYYNNKLKDILFRYNVNALYGEDILLSESLFYSNSEGLITVTEDVKVTNLENKLFADKVEFDLSTKKLNITMFKNDQVNIILNK